MADAAKITPDELRRRMDAGEDFTVIDVRNSNAWAQSDVMIPEAIRVPLDNLEESLQSIPKKQAGGRVLHLTRRSFQHQFGAETTGTRLHGRLGAQRRLRCVAERRAAGGIETTSGVDPRS